MIHVFKFGGASVKDADGIKNVVKILSGYKDQSLVIVVSAIGKTTNALEEVIFAHAENNGKAKEIYETVKLKHYAIMEELFPKGHEAFDAVNDIFVEADWVLDEPAPSNFDYMYDQIICIGELVSSKILGAYLNFSGINTTWLDARDLIATDDHYREGWVIWDKTKKNIVDQITPILSKPGFVLTQGFIGSTSDNQTVTLGREGSDYTGAILAYSLDAEDMTIWKDVPGVLTADPRMFDNVVKLDRLSYKEAIEMTYFGASVIHPKTIKPLQNKNIPLHVKSFLDPEAKGSTISEDVQDFYPPIVIVQKAQTLLNISTRDFSFVAEHHMAEIFELMSKHRIFVNLMQNSAITFTLVINNFADRVDMLVKEIEQEYKVIREDNIELITIRHYSEQVVDELKKGKIVLTEQRIPATVQLVVRDIPIMTRKS
jgi:aspartate kinase